MNVHLRQRKQTKEGGRISLYLEIYRGTTKDSDGKVKGLRAYEYLNLYLVDKPRTPIDKQQNKDNLKLAEGIKAKRELEIKNGQYGFASEFKKTTNFIDYFKRIMEKRKESKGNYGNWDSTLKHLINFAGGHITFQEVDKNFCERFKDYLTNEAKVRGSSNLASTKSGKNLSSSAVFTYYTKFRACLNRAVEEEIILKSPAKNVSAPNIIENKREYLTFEELQALVKTECRYEVLKRAFLFSSLTGLRWSDVFGLQWSEVQKNNYTDKEGNKKMGWRIVFHQQKTKGLQYHDISEQAREFLGTHGKSDEVVFTGLRYSSYLNVELQRWVMAAGISKHISFHCARHTCAVLQLTYGTDIFTVSKILGHTSLKTTQIYAKIVDEKKREAVNKIPDLTI